MKGNRSFWPTGFLCLSLLTVLACNMGTAPASQPPNPSIAETEVQLRVMATSLTIQQMTLDAAQAQPPDSPPSGQSAPPPTWTSLPPQQVQPPTPVPADTLPPASLVLDIQKSVNTFFCYQPPYELTLTVTVSDINRGMAVYYHIRDKSTGVTSDPQVIDLHRKTGITRDATIVGGGSDRQNLQFPALMGESYFVYQIISDDGAYRSPTFSDVTFFPCAQ